MAGLMDSILIQRFAAFTGAGTDVETQRSDLRIRVIVAHGCFQAGHGPQMTRRHRGDLIEQRLANGTVSQCHLDEGTSCVVIAKHETA
jgi:hypothetical protein